MFKVPPNVLVLSSCPTTAGGRTGVGASLGNTVLQREKLALSHLYHRAM